MRLGVLALLALGAGWIVGGNVSRAAATPPEAEAFPELQKAREPKRDPTPLEQAVDRAAAVMARGSGPVSGPEAVEFALWLYADRGRVADRERAARSARALAGDSLGSGAIASLYRIAQAGGATLGEAESAYRTRQGELAAMSRVGTLPYALFVLDAFARAAATGDPPAIGDALLTTGTFWQLRTRQERNQLRIFGLDGKPEDLAGHAAALRVGLEAAALSGSPPVREECRLLSHEILKRYWDEDAEQFRDAEMPPSSALRINALAALAVWEAGKVTGDALLTGRGQRALEMHLEASLGNPTAVAAAGLAAARMARHPVQMALIGDAAEPTLVSLRQAAYRLFEPSKLMLNLDPAVDAARFAELLFPPDLAPALFICVETVCSPPLTKADDLSLKVTEIRKLAGETTR